MAIMDKSDWSGCYQSVNIDEIYHSPKNDAVCEYINQYIEPSLGKSCFEIGVYPGCYLQELGKKGFELNGIDYYEHTKALTEKLRQDYTVGEILIDDFDQFSSTKKYDLVCSFGFIEHYSNYQEVFQRHLSMVKPGGEVLVTFPNFYGSFQNLTHKYLDRKNYNHHHIPSMEITQYLNFINLEKFEILYCDYYGEYDIWFENNKGLAQIFRKLLSVSRPVLKKILPKNSKTFAPYAVIHLKEIANK